MKYIDIGEAGFWNIDLSDERDRREGATLRGRYLGCMLYKGDARVELTYDQLLSVQHPNQPSKLGGPHRGLLQADGRYRFFENAGGADEKYEDLRVPQLNTLVKDQG